MLVLIATVVGVIGVLASLAFNGWQATQLLKQLRLQWSMAGLSGTHQPIELLHGILRFFYEDPSLRPYFYEGKALPAVGDRRSQVLAVGEMLGDVLEVGLFHSREIEAAANHEDWLDYATFLMENSPTLDHLARAHPRWYPLLVPLLRDVPKDLSGPEGVQVGAET
ncbi:hypothetical protein GCM10010435_57420 [Winogradskya consettensis]|uniref:Uncharacterized protein n=2 Tax=Winogradskya TaxID=3240235 RepID=A0A919SA45_9ACTN|nr:MULTISPECIES: hypothetical protein [Actinoplanes]GIE19353.1 hypothetical protein Ahu01nite_024550 [Actinoplanes humidus]GIM67133.1 hypothetical protein Aco04nite_04900 [Actinoplanes consettensis]